MRRIIAAVAGFAMLGVAAGEVSAHAFLDHASPAVGSAVPTAPAAVTLWFTQDLEPAFSHVTVTNTAGQRVDLNNARVVPRQPATLQVGLKPLSPGSYTVNWHVVSVDTHPTEGTFMFRGADDGGESELLLDRNGAVRARWTAAQAAGLPGPDALAAAAARAARFSFSPPIHAGHVH